MRFSTWWCIMCEKDRVRRRCVCQCVVAISLLRRALRYLRTALGNSQLLQSKPHRVYPDSVDALFITASCLRPVQYVSGGCISTCGGRLVLVHRRGCPSGIKTKPSLWGHHSPTGRRSCGNLVASLRTNAQSRVSHVQTNLVHEITRNKPRGTPCTC